MGNELSLIKYIQLLEQELCSIRLENQRLANAEKIAKTDENFSLRNIIKLMPGNIFWKDIDGKYLGANNNVAKLLGLDSAEDIVGKRNRDIMDTKYAHDLDQFDKECIESGQGRYFEEPGFDLKNNPAIYFTQKLPLRNNQGQIIGLVGISMDITERKKIEQELQLAKEKAEASSQAKSQFLAVVNHELRTPLTGILGLIAMLKDGTPDAEQYLNIINNLDNCSQYLLALVNDVLDLTSLDNNNNSLKMQAVNLHELTDEVLSILEGLAKDKNLSLTHCLNNAPPILTDAKAIKQILINLIGNAIKFTNKGGIKVLIEHQLINHKSIFLKIKINDTGCGIPSDKLDFIFEPFKQLQDTHIRSSSRAGTGLGLAIVKRLAQLLGCKIEVESKAGRGSSFIITGEFELATVENKQLQKMATDKTGLPIDKKEKIKVLLVEDDKIVQIIHKRMLSDLNCNVDLAYCGQEALALLNDQDIAFVDIGLSDMSGFELIAAIRAHQTKIQRDFPIIALTGYTGEKERAECLKAGANEVAIKPISAESLGRLLEIYCHI